MFDYFRVSDGALLSVGLCFIQNEVNGYFRNKSTLWIFFFIHKTTRKLTHLKQNVLRINYIESDGLFSNMNDFYLSIH